MVIRFNLFNFIQSHCQLVMQYDADLLDKMSEIPAPPETMMIDVHHDTASMHTRKIRALTASQGVQLLVTYSDIIPVYLYFTKDLKYCRIVKCSSQITSYLSRCDVDAKQ